MKSMIHQGSAQILFYLPQFFHIIPMLPVFYWLPVAARIRFKTQMLTYKAKFFKALIAPHTVPRSLWFSSTA